MSAPPSLALPYRSGGSAASAAGAGKLREFQYSVKNGRVVDAEMVRRRVFEPALNERDALMNWPAQVAPLTELRVDIFKFETKGPCSTVASPSMTLVTPVLSSPTARQGRAAARGLDAGCRLSNTLSFQRETLTKSVQADQMPLTRSRYLLPTLGRGYTPVTVSVIHHRALPFARVQPGARTGTVRASVLPRTTLHSGVSERIIVHRPDAPNPRFVMMGSGVRIPLAAPRKLLM
jgi:hypothetical protein